MAFGAALTLLSVLAFQRLVCELPATDSAATAVFLRLVNVYGQGQSAQAIRELDKLGDGVLERIIDRGAAGVSDGCLEAASLLVTELAMTYATKSRWVNADAHFDAAWKISYLIEGPVRRHYQRDWLLAAGLFHHQLVFAQTGDEGGFARAEEFLRNAVKRYSDDPEVLLAAGALLEWAGSLRFGESAHLKEAEQLYARARKLAPSDAMLLLRHGKVLQKLGRYDEAEPALLQVLTLPAQDDVHYRSRMALGGMAERDGRLPDAIAHYEAAANRIATWQVAHLALAHAFHNAEAHDRAREALEWALSLNMEEADEVHGGWWSYELGIALRFEPLMERMRAEVKR